MAIKKLTKEEFFGLFDSDVKEDIVYLLNRNQDAVAIVVAECLDMSSSNLGARTAMVVGPSNTYKTVEECEGKWLYDLPSQRQYFTGYCPREEVL